MERKHDFSLRRLVNAVHGRPYCDSFHAADLVGVFSDLRELQSHNVTGRLTNYAWVPVNRSTIDITPQEAIVLLEKKANNDAINRAIEHEMDYSVYYGKSGRKRYILEIYKAYTDFQTKQKVRLPGKVMKLEFLVSP